LTISEKPMESALAFVGESENFRRRTSDWGSRGKGGYPWEDMILTGTKRPF